MNVIKSTSNKEILLTMKSMDVLLGAFFYGKKLFCLPTPPRQWVSLILIKIDFANFKAIDWYNKTQQV